MTQTSVSQPESTLQSGIAIGLLSSSVISSQIILMQIFSITQWHHFGYMVISLAMLGFGAAGTFLAIFRKTLVARSSWIIPLLIISGGLSFGLVHRISETALLRFDLYHLFIDPIQLWRFIGTCIVFFFPYFLCALAIGILFTMKVRQIGTLYFWNLAGSGAGGALSLLLLNHFFPWVALPLVSIIAIIAAVLMMHTIGIVWRLSVAFLSITVISVLLVDPHPVRPSQYKSLSRTLSLPDSRVLHSQPSIYGVINVVHAPTLRYAPGTSLRFTGEVPVSDAVFINADWKGILPRYWESQAHPHHYTTMALPYALRLPDTVLVINDATGQSAAHALSAGAEHVVISEDNRKLVELMKGILAPRSENLFHNPRVCIYTIDARAFLAKNRKYDLIVLPVLDAFGGTAGLFALQENYLLTVEGFSAKINSLTYNGLLAVSCWLDYPVRTPLKITATLEEVFRQRGVANLADHIIMIKSWGTATFLASVNPFTQRELDIILSFCDSLFFDPVIFPGVTPEMRNRYNLFHDPFLFTALDSIMAGELLQLNREYPFHILPAFDDQPYFFQFLRLRGLSELSEFFGQQAVPFIELGYLIVFVTLVITAVLSVVLIVLPLFRLRRSGKGMLTVLLYFGGIGLGFMFLEIVLIQQLVWMFGNAVISASVVISTLLVASGIGSYVSGRWNMTASKHRFVFVSIIVCMLALMFVSQPLIQWGITQPVFMRAIIVLLMVGLPGFVMGMPFPLGLRCLDLNNPQLIPWGWGINGCLSVIASPLAMIVAVEAGFRVVMLAAVIVYLIALLASRDFYQR